MSVRVGGTSHGGSVTSGSVGVKVFRWMSEVTPLQLILGMRGCDEHSGAVTAVPLFSVGQADVEHRQFSPSRLPPCLVPLGVVTKRWSAARYCRNREG
jgi:hypothetical protein